MRRGLMLFRRDLRLVDNTALNAALRENDEVVLMFIADPRQIGSGNAYRGVHALEYMLGALVSLEKACGEMGGKLVLLHGSPETEMGRIIDELELNAVYVNDDYTPFSIERDATIREVCMAKKVAVHSFHDALLTPPGYVLNGQGKPFAVFTHFYKKASERDVSRPVTEVSVKFSQLSVSGSISVTDLARICGVSLLSQGGRESAEMILKSLMKYADYKHTRDIPALSGTTRLSAHLKFGTVSVREVYWAMRDALGGSQHVALTRQLYWRDFFSHVSYFHPRVFGHAYDDRFDRLEWDEPGEKFALWKEGKTGFPIVDAGMRELFVTGFMHNRVRMIAASFLTKDLHIHWREGERYFAQMLSDYDPAVNNGNWQWVGGTGCDAQPWFRIFNPWLQQKKFDPECVYIKRWVRELASVPNEEIHKWHHKFREHAEGGYPAPIVDHAAEAKVTKMRYGRR